MSAKIYSVPADWKAKIPEFPNGMEPTPIDEYLKTQETWVENFKAWVRSARGTGAGSLIGEEVRFPVADGCARYIVCSERPLGLVHLPIGDAWGFPYVNRLTLKDIRHRVETDKRIAAIFAAPRS